MPSHLIAFCTITKNTFCHLRPPPRDSDKLRFLLKGFVWATRISEMKIVQKIRNEHFQIFFELYSNI